MKTLFEIINKIDVRVLRKVASAYGVKYSRMKRKNELVEEITEQVEKEEAKVIEQAKSFLGQPSAGVVKYKDFLFVPRTVVNEDGASVVSTVTILFFEQVFQVVKGDEHK